MQEMLKSPRPHTPQGPVYSTNDSGKQQQWDASPSKDFRRLNDSVTLREVVAAMAVAGGCTEREIRTGEIVSSPADLGSISAQCPQTVARKLAAAGRGLIGWSSARVEALPRGVESASCAPTPSKKWGCRGKIRAIHPRQLHHLPTRQARNPGRSVTVPKLHRKSLTSGGMRSQ
ncbi:hypothetical protein KM043_017529 [Ampulex compressa]|nr:hypothetical protein KM043_017529 [Ampulex compressa]